MLNSRHSILLLAWVAILSVLLVTVIQQWSSVRIFETRMLALLPEADFDSAVQLAMDKINEQTSQQVFWMIESSNEEELLEFSKQLRIEIDNSKLFSKVGVGQDIDELGRKINRLKPHRYQLMSDFDRIQITENPQQFIDSSIEQLYSPLGYHRAAALDSDPLYVYSNYVATLLSNQITVRDGFIIPSGPLFKAILPSQLNSSAFDINAQWSLYQLHQRLLKNFANQSVQLKVGGMPIFASHGAVSAKREIQTIGIGSALAVLVLLIVTFRSIRPLILAMLSISCGVLAGAVANYWVFGSIHLLTWIFGATLIGVSVDYCFHLLCDGYGDESWSVDVGIRRIFQPTLLGLSSSILAYLSLITTSFPALKEIAVFSASGLFFSWLTVVSVSRGVLFGYSVKGSSAIINGSQWLALRRRSIINNSPLWMKLSFLVFIMIGLTLLSPVDDIRRLQGASKQLLSEDESIRSQLPLSIDNQFYIIEADTIDQLLYREHQLSVQLKTLVEVGELSAYFALSDRYPSLKQQRSNYDVLKKSIYDSGLMVGYLETLQLDPELIRQELQQFYQAKDSSLTLDHWLQSVPQPWSSLASSCSDGCRSLVLLSGIKKLDSLSGINREGVEFIDPSARISFLFERYRLTASVMIALAIGVVLIFLSFILSWSSAVRIVSVPLIAMAISLSFVGWSGTLFSVFNLFALLLVFGIGIDYALFNHLGQTHQERTNLAVLLSAITTVIAFGLLFLSETTVISAFGITVGVGIVAAYLLAPLASPRQLEERRS